MPAFITRHEARRIALNSLGFGRSHPADGGASRAFGQVMTRLGLIQLDSVNVCVRSHYLPFYSRSGSYHQPQLDIWLNRPRRHFEYWGHEASVMAVNQYPLWRWKMDAWQPGKRAAAILREQPELVDEVLQKVQDRGPSSIRELDIPNPRGGGGWGHGPGKLLLEALFGQGRLTALRGPNFMRRYDLPERAIPASILKDRRYDRQTAQRELLRQAAQHYGLATERDLADYFRLKVTEAAPRIAELIAENELEPVSVEGWKRPAYRHPTARCPRRIACTTLISPFDPIVWRRERAERLFQFRYRLEIYTPEPKRRYSYYVLPFMLDGELVARVDLKANRGERQLRVQSAFIEPDRDRDRVAARLSQELERFASWLELGSISLGRRGNLMSGLRKALS